MITAHPSLLRELFERCATLRRRLAANNSAQTARRLEDAAHTLCVTGGEASRPPWPARRSHEGNLLKAGTVLTFHQRRANRSGRAVVTPNGQLVVDGHATPFPSPPRRRRP
ncbi:DUF5133 domain-containing protein [Streptomyces galilaeus]|uniref:DUF5133 domain-containing protein n=1 Tax=Streptomyces galilaeus TaxID=33899 RepID=UPI0038F75256